MHELKTDRLHPHSLLMLGHMCNLHRLFHSDLPFACAMVGLLTVLLPFQKFVDDTRSKAEDSKSLHLTPFDLLDLIKVADHKGPIISIEYLDHLYSEHGLVVKSIEKGGAASRWSLTTDAKRVVLPQQVANMRERFSELRSECAKRMSRLKGHPGAGAAERLMFDIGTKPQWGYLTKAEKQVEVEQDSSDSEAVPSSNSESSSGEESGDMGGESDEDHPKKRGSSKKEKHPGGDENVGFGSEQDSQATHREDSGSDESRLVCCTLEWCTINETSVCLAYHLFCCNMRLLYTVFCQKLTVFCEPHRPVHHFMLLFWEHHFVKPTTLSKFVTIFCCSGHACSNFVFITCISGV